MILLQILTGRRASEIRTCDADCIEPVTDTAITAAGGEQIARTRWSCRGRPVVAARPTIIA
jgi:hypothetical protein